MSSTEKNRESELERAVSDVVGEPLDPRVIEQAAARVWGRLSQPHPAAAQGAPDASAAHGALRTCDDYARLIPAYLAGELPPARALLVEDHARTCITCRRTLRDLREGRTGHVAAAARPARHSLGGRRARLALAASLAAAVGLSSFFFVREIGFGADSARVEAVDGLLFEVAGETVRPVAAGTRIGEGEEVRTARGARAVLRLADGSRIEMNERSALSYDARRSGTTIDLEHGRIMVQAAKQTEGRHLYVATDDCRVAVVGTIFSVNHGTKGSRVSVVEGRVRVARNGRGGREDMLVPGGQVTTRATVAAVPVAQEVAWSQDAPRYQALLAQLTSLGREIDSQVERPGLRFSTRLLDLAPAGTMVYVALPNLTASLADTQRLLDQRLAENTELAQWWRQTLGTGERAEGFRETIERIGALGRYLGDELAIAVTPDGPVALAEVTDAAAFRAALEQEADRLSSGGHSVLRLVDGPTPATAGAGDGEALLAWVSDGLFVATPNAGLLARMGAVVAQPDANPFRSTSFHDKVAAAYADGAGWLFSGDVKALMRQGHEPAGGVDRTAESLGILDLDHFILDRRESGGHTEMRAALTFDRPRRGVASWLAAPGPMGALAFISPEANLAASFVVRDPASLLDDLIATSPELVADLERLRNEHGFDLRELAASLGGELALAVDGPLLPTPSWKLVVEVYDPVRLDRAIAELVSRLDAEARGQGRAGLALTSEEAGGRTYHKIATRDTKLEVYYLYEDGYLVAGPSRALLDSAVKLRQAGNTLVAAAKFQDLLPADKQVNFSALVYHDLGSVLQPLAGAAGRLAEGAQAPQGTPQGQPSPQEAVALLAASGPTLAYAYGEENRILFASNGEAGPLGLNLGTLVGLGGIFGYADASGQPDSQTGGGAGAAR